MAYIPYSKNLTLWGNADNLITTVANNNNNTIVVTHSVGPAIVEAWIDHPNVTALIWANVPGQEAGNSIVDVLYGDYNPSGRLPYTIAKSASDYPTQLITSEDPAAIISIPYTEGLFIDYRHFDAVSGAFDSCCRCQNTETFGRTTSSHASSSVSA